MWECCPGWLRQEMELTAGHWKCNKDNVILYFWFNSSSLNEVCTVQSGLIQRLINKKISQTLVKWINWVCYHFCCWTWLWLTVLQQEAILYTIVNSLANTALGHSSSLCSHVGRVSQASCKEDITQSICGKWLILKSNNFLSWIIQNKCFLQGQQG